METDVPEIALNMNETDLPVNPCEAKQWLHMGVVEYDKLQWTIPEKPVTKTAPDSKKAR